MSYHTHIPLPVLKPAHVCVTLRLADPSDDLLVRHIRLLRDCVTLSRQRWEFAIDAAVVLPNEMQLLCAFSDADFGVRGAIRLITTAFVRHLPGAPRRHSAIWSDTRHMIEIASPVVALRRAFIEAAPVRAGLVKQPCDWPYSSAHNGTVQASDMGVAVA